ncbi:DNA-directed RNA polymerase sigma-70 factor [Prolixibacter bellariivorans]|uniref:DNA-directed RNA polymerase sigma-70 factor n=1 Tax=Prolixibacter bellariivorans TaxID=314319 RepID=A0A5M4AV19_9BACT|nr:RNA polymerase sigma-70 factor [Prolixibacter bellariivorans]GET31493.1 DNA-directed RNA polymerase sigma-70 factor [Prolixibacter bellariivorans]
MHFDLTDVQLMNKIRVGDFDAFRLLFERYYSSLCNFANSRLQDDFIAEDVVQELFTKVWEERTRIKFTGSIKSYLYTAVKNRSLNRLNAEMIRRKHAGAFRSNQNEQASDIDLELEEFRNYLFECIEKLPPRCKTVFEKSRFEDLKQQEIASVMEISVKTVKAQIGKALKLVKTCVELVYPEFSQKN